MRKILSLLVVAILFTPTILPAQSDIVRAENVENSAGSIIVLAESGYEGCSIKIVDQGKDIVIKISNIDRSYASNLGLFSSERSPNANEKDLIETAEVFDGNAEFRLPNLGKVDNPFKLPTVEHIRIKFLSDGSGLEFDQDNQWVYFGDNPDGSINRNDSKIGIVMYPNFPPVPLNIIESEEGVLKPGKHPELK
ncbi:MAG: hypothetical protein WAV31_03745 [Candidatus Moraniibacteriota bacterium]